jgi:hypothetical protein
MILLSRLEAETHCAEVGVFAIRRVIPLWPPPR